MKHAKGKQNLSSPPAPKRGVYDMPFPAPEYREVRMVSDDGVPLVDIRIHDRAQCAQLADPVPMLRAWLEQIYEQEARDRHGGLKLV